MPEVHFNDEIDALLDIDTADPDILRQQMEVWRSAYLTLREQAPGRRDTEITVRIPIDFTVEIGDSQNILDPVSEAVNAVEQGLAQVTTLRGFGITKIETAPWEAREVWREETEKA